jgi:hypothetical protein
VRLFEQTWPEGDYRFWQLGFAVEDLLGAAARWSTVFGVGPFHVLPPIETQCTYRGTPSAVNLQVAVTQAGPVQIELIKQHCDRPSVYREPGRASSSGFHQICTITRDYDAKRKHFEQLGYDLVSELTTPQGQRVGFFDTSDDFGFYTEVAEDVPGFLTLLGSISETCATWDGTDPVRILTRDGYRLP